jgi:hypothetical protein
MCLLHDFVLSFKGKELRFQVDNLEKCRTASKFKLLKTACDEEFASVKEGTRLTLATNILSKAGLLDIDGLVRCR